MFEALFNAVQAARQIPAPPKRKGLRRAKTQGRKVGKAISVRQAAPIVEVCKADSRVDYDHYRFGGLRGLQRHGHYKEVRVADPFQQKILHFPTPLAADNWLVSCFGRSLVCTVPTAPMLAMDHGRILNTRSALHLITADSSVADLVIHEMDDAADRKWQLFQVVARAHGFRPELRTALEIRSDVVRLQSLERMRQQLVQHVGDMRCHLATASVDRFLRSERGSTVGELCNAIAHDHLPAGAVECAAISLYRLGAVEMNISEAMYGAHTTIHVF